jgi:Flp pilus assembly protein TadG
MIDRDNESGQALVLVALSMAVIMGFMALAIDVGLLFRSKRNLQIAADAAATAAAVNYLYYGNITTAKAAAVAAAAANGVTISASDVHSAPTYGPYTGTTAGAYFEVIPQQPVGTNFMGVITRTSATNVAARAVAGTPTASDACIYIASPAGNDVFHLQGKTTINAPGCGIYVNSSSSNAIQITGNASTVNATYFDANGPYTGRQTSPTPITANVPAVSDPLGNISGPNPASACNAGNTVTVATVKTTTPISSSNGVTCFSASNVTLSANITLPGGVIYVFENGVTIGGTMTLGSSASGVTLDIYSGTFNQGNSNLSVYAPTSGTYNGIAIMQPASNTNQLQVQFGSGNETLDGLIYAPGAQVYLQDNGGGVTATGVFADTMFIKSSSLTIPSYSAAHPTTTPLRAVTLVE